MDGQYFIKYEYLDGINGERFPFVVYVHNERGELVYTSGIYVPEEKCKIPEIFQEVCKISPSEYLVKSTVDSLIKNQVSA